MSSASCLPEQQRSVVLLFQTQSPHRQPVANDTPSSIALVCQVAVCSACPCNLLSRPPETACLQHRAFTTLLPGLTIPLSFRLVAYRAQAHVYVQFGHFDELIAFMSADLDGVEKVRQRQLNDDLVTSCLLRVWGAVSEKHCTEALAKVVRLQQAFLKITGCTHSLGELFEDLGLLTTAVDLTAETGYKENKDSMESLTKKAQGAEYTGILSAFLACPSLAIIKATVSKAVAEKERADSWKSHSLAVVKLVDQLKEATADTFSAKDRLELQTQLRQTFATLPPPAEKDDVKCPKTLTKVAEELATIAEAALDDAVDAMVNMFKKILDSNAEGSATTDKRRISSARLRATGSGLHDPTAQFTALSGHQRFVAANSSSIARLKPAAQETIEVDNFGTHVLELIMLWEQNVGTESLGKLLGSYDSMETAWTKLSEGAKATLELEKQAFAQKFPVAAKIKELLAQRLSNFESTVIGMIEAAVKQDGADGGEVASLVSKAMEKVEADEHELMQLSSSCESPEASRARITIGKVIGCALMAKVKSEKKAEDVCGAGASANVSEALASEFLAVLPKARMESLATLAAYDVALFMEILPGVKQELAEPFLQLVKSFYCKALYELYPARALSLRNRVAVAT